MLGALVGNALEDDVGVALGALAVRCWWVGKMMASSSGLQKESRTATLSALVASSWDTAM